MPAKFDSCKYELSAVFEKSDRRLHMFVDLDIKEGSWQYQSCIRHRTPLLAGRFLKFRPCTKARFLLERASWNKIVTRLPCPASLNKLPQYSIMRTTL